MKRIVLFFVSLNIFSFICSITLAQNFSFYTAHPTIVDTLNSEIVFDIPIINKSAGTLRVDVIRTNQVLPINWQGSMCFDESCFPPEVDSVGTTMAAGDTVDFSYHIFANEIPGTGTLTVTARNLSNPTEKISINLTAKTQPTGIKDNSRKIVSFNLEQNYPNPFNPSTRIQYTLNNTQHVVLKVYNLLGNEIATLVNKQQTPGSYQYDFNYSVPAGVYFYKLTAGNYTQTRKMILIK
jgi:hypothetical protein